MEGDAAPGPGERRRQDGGVLDSVFGYTPGFGYVAVVLALTYLWLPFMILPIYAGLERLPAVGARRVRRPRRQAVAHVRAA